ncbi:MAG TPA: DNA repair protein RecN [Tepidisphaeraceae bacterium]|jgi:DNA repair protein RecN (Recombination protein N)
MLRELHISNLAVIADARIELTAGLNCFTGATGAGKSLVIGAIELLLGLRSPADMLRKGADEGRVSGIFDVRDKRLLKQIETACDLPVSAEGGEILLTRRVFSSGRSGVSLNGNPITLAMLKNVAEALVDVHGQHDHQFLLRPSNQLSVIDEFAGLVSLREQYNGVFNELSTIRQRLSDLQAGTRLREQQLDLARYQLKELETADLQPNEYEDLTARAQVLNNLGRLRNDAGAVQQSLSEADDALVDRLQTIASTLAELAEVDAALAPVATAVKEASIQLSESSFDLGRYLNRLDLDPGELAEVNERLNTLNRVVKKYGPTVDDVIAKRAELTTQVAALERAGEDTTELSAKLKPLGDRLDTIGRELSAKRQKAAIELKPRIESQLGALGMDKATFSVDVRTADPGPSGADDIEFLVRTNPGLAEAPLRKIASGGEMSRIMLALKGVLAAGDRVSVLVFDEIDANIGGRLGAVIGEKLRSLAEHQQVLCITHLPQIACYADRHLTVRKEQEKDKTITTVRVMNGDERIEEIAEMIGGHRITETTRAQARELLETAKTPAKSPKRRKQSA